MKRIRLSLLLIVVVLAIIVSIALFRSWRLKGLQHDLLVAATRGDVSHVGHLLELGVIPGPNVLYRACLRSSDQDIIRLLLEKGADPNGLPDKRPLLIASFNGNVDIVRLLVTYGADPNVKGRHGSTALMMASTKAVASLLLEKGADVNTRTEDGQTALHGFAAIPDRGLIQLVLLHGADANARDVLGSTPLHYVLETFGRASTKDVADVCSDLVRAGAKSDLRNDEGVSPLDLARRTNETIIMKSLSSLK